MRHPLIRSALARRSARAAVNSGVAALRMPARLLVIRVSAQAMRRNGTDDPVAARTRASSGRTPATMARTPGHPRRRVSQPAMAAVARARRRATTVAGPSSVTATLMKRNDDPQMAERRARVAASRGSSPRWGVASGGAGARAERPAIFVEVGRDLTAVNGDVRPELLRLQIRREQ